MLLKDKTAVVYGAGGAIGSAVVRAFARAGAKVFATARSRSRLTQLVDDVIRLGGFVVAGEVDALEERGVERHLASVVAEAGSVDVSFNAVGIPQTGIQGTPLVELSADAFARPLDVYPKAHFLTARAAARHMAERGSGVILTLTATPARMHAPFVGGMAPAWAAVEALTRVLAAELGPQGVRVVGLRFDGIPETETLRTVYGLHASRLGIDLDQFQEIAVSMTARKRLPSLEELANAAVFFASDLANAMTGTVANLSGGSVVD